MPSALTFWGFLDWLAAGAAIALGWWLMTAVIGAVMSMLGGARAPRNPTSV